MALIPANIHRITGTITRMTSVSDADYFVANFEGNRYFRLRTYASIGSEQQKVSQTLDFDEASARALVDALRTAFGI